MIYFSDFGVTPFGVLLKRTTDQSGLPATIAWDSEVYDLSGWHDNSTNNTRATVPSGVDYIRINSGLQKSAFSSEITTHKIDGANFRGMGQATGEQYCNAVSAIVAVTPGQYVEQTGSADTILAVAFSFLGVEKVDSSLKRALVYKTGTQSLSALTTTTLTFNAEVYDTDAFHDNTTNNSRVTAPADGYYRVGCNAILTGSPGAIGRLTLTKDGATTTYGLFFVDTDQTNSELNGWSAPIFFSAGQYAEAQMLTQVPSTVSAGEATWLSMEEVPTTSKICLVYRSTNQNFTAATPEAIGFDSEVYDPHGMHDNSTNNTRLTVPSGCSRARIQANTVGPAGAAWLIYPTKNGSTFAGAPSSCTQNSGSNNGTKFWSPWIDVVPGDYFEIICQASSSATLTTGTRLWASLECQP